MPNLTALLLGSTGETGKELLKHLCDCSQFTKVILVGRRRVEDGPSTVDKVEQRVVDFDKLVCLCNGVIQLSRLRKYFKCIQGLLCTEIISK